MGKIRSQPLDHSSLCTLFIPDNLVTISKCCLALNQSLFGSGQSRSSFETNVCRIHSCRKCKISKGLPTVRNGLFLAISYQNGYLTIRIVTFLGYLLSFLEARASLVVRILVVHSVALDFLG